MTLESNGTEHGIDVGARYQLVRPLGHGGFGAVFEAIDHGSGQRVAIKVLRHVKASALAAFKREFRTLADVSHPNLVGLRELYEHQGTWLIVMELVTGTDLLSWVGRTSSVMPLEAEALGFDELRVRQAFADVACGLASLHEHGLLHRDLKPSNVRVTPEGCAVLLDFGLVTPSDREAQSTLQRAPGTVAYMAPEQAEGGKIGPPADFYALGTCLYEALTARLPFEEPSAFTLALRKLREDAPPPSHWAPGIPADLDVLCSELLARAPEQRPSFERVLSTLIGETGLPSRRPSSPELRSYDPDSLFTGRTEELAVLDQELFRTHEGHLSLTFVQGDSGIGKTTLVQRLVQRQLARARDTWVLSGRCFEHERVPYKAFDGCIDVLAKLLGRVPAGACAALLPPNAALLVELFPVLRMVPSLESAQRPPAPADPSARRREAFLVLSRLLGKLAETRPLIMVIDDLQWADDESLRLLEVLISDQPPALFLLCTLRPAQEIDPALRDGLARLQGAASARTLVLSGLSDEAASELTRKLLRGPASETLRGRILQESRGHPLLLAELVRYVRCRGDESVTDLSLDAVLDERMALLTPHARALLETLSLCTEPHPEALFAELYPESTLGSAIKELLGERLARRNASFELAPAHDRIRKSVQARISSNRLQILHRSLARALERTGLGDASQVATHWDRAGQQERASSAYIRAAAEAMESLAFATAAQHYERALTLLGDGPARTRLLPLLARALAALGKSREAARAFEEAAQRHQGAEQVRLRVLAAQHQIQSAQPDAGMLSARAVLTDLGVPLPRGALGSIGRITWERALLALRGMRVDLREHVPAEDKLTLDTVAALSFPITWIEFLPGNALNVHHLRRALDSGEPGHAARALSQEGTFRSLRGELERSRRLFAEAERLVGKADDVAATAFVRFAKGTADVFSGRLVDSLREGELAEALLSQTCPDESWLLTNVRMLLLNSLFQLGEHRRFSAAFEAFRSEAEDRRDAFAVHALLNLGSGFAALLMQDDPARARDELQGSMAPWKPRAFGFPHLGELYAMTTIWAYEGNREALSWIDEHWTLHSRAPILRAGQPRDILMMARCLAGFAAWDAVPAARRPALLARLESRALRARSSAWGAPFRSLLRAQLLALRGKTEPALKAARDAHAHLLRLGLLPAASCARYLIGTLEGGENGAAERDSALAFFASEGWKAPEHAIATYAPAARFL